MSWRRSLQPGDLPREADAGPDSVASSMTGPWQCMACTGAGGLEGEWGCGAVRMVPFPFDALRGAPDSGVAEGLGLARVAAARAPRHQMRGGCGSAAGPTGVSTLQWEGMRMPGMLGGCQGGCQGGCRGLRWGEVAGEVHLRRCRGVAHAGPAFLQRGRAMETGHEPRSCVSASLGVRGDRWPLEAGDAQSSQVHQAMAEHSCRYALYASHEALCHAAGVCVDAQRTHVG